MNARFNSHVLTRLSWSMVCAAACLGCTQLAMAADAEAVDSPTITVFYGDLNLQRPAAIASLYRRIERAAARVCTRSNSGAVQQKYAARRCAEQAIDRAVVSINMPELAKYAADTKARASETSG